MTPSGEDDSPPPGRFRSRAIARVTARMKGSAHADGSVEIGEISDQLDHLGPLYLLMAVACIAVSPLSGIPFVTTLCGLSIAILSGQLLLGRRAVWMPGPLHRLAVRMDRLQAGLGRADRVAGRVEAALRRRWVWLTRGPVRVVLLSACVAFGLVMPFMEVVPFAGTTLGAVVLLVALALIARDGLVALLAGVAVCAIFGGAGLVLT